MNRILVVAVVAAVTFVRAQTPADGEVPLPALAGWQANLIHQSDAGVWYAHVAKVVPHFGANEVIVTDDKGRHVLLTVYSGKWTANTTVGDGQWLAPTRPADVDPRWPGSELYAAGKGGSVFQIVLQPQPFGRFVPQSREIGHAAGEEFHAVLAADLLADTPGDELLAFGITGAVWQLVPEAGADGAFAMRLLQRMPGRVRDTVVAPAIGGAGPEFYGASRSGDLLALQLTATGLQSRVLLHEDSGLGRVALRPANSGAATVLYATRDDGVLLRVERQQDGSWRREPIFVGAQGLRGVAAGRFDADPTRETVAVYGYGKEVVLIARTGSGPWQAETIFRGEQQGHWLAVGELDGRNGTDELVATGFLGQVVLLARPHGYGQPGAARVAAMPPAPAGERPVRIAARVGEVGLRELSPLRYQGGFESKALVYETLVRRGPDGRIVPGLASAWRLEDDGRAFVFTLRDGATFHDGSAVTAAAVAAHFRRWVGLPEHSWLASNDRITAVRAVGPRELRIELDRPWALLPDLCAINPTAIRAPAALDREGDFVRPVGSGSHAFVELREQQGVLRYRRHHGSGPDLLDLVRVLPEQDPLDRLLAGDLDAVLGSWTVPVDPQRAAALQRDPRVQVSSAPGSSMLHLLVRGHGTTAARDVRRAIGAAIDRKDLVATVVAGFGDPSTGWAAPSVTCWPQGRPCAPEGPVVAPTTPLRLRIDGIGDLGGALGGTLVAQLQRAGLPAQVVGADVADWDLRLERTHGVPYDPFTTLMQRFAPPAAHATAASPGESAFDRELVALCQGMQQEPDERRRELLHAKVQEHLDREVPLVPLFAPRRLAIVRAGLPAPRLDHDMYGLDVSWLPAGR